MDSRTKKIARTGYIAKGSVYGLIGILTFLAAFNLGGEKADQMQVLDFLDEQPFGNALLIIMALGLACYAVWRFTQCFSDPEGMGSDKKAIVKRTAFFISGCSYLALGYLAVMQGIGNGSDSGGSGDQSSQLASIGGMVLIGIVGAVFAGRGIYQFVRAYQQKFLKKFNFDALDEKKRKSIKNTAYMGLASRGIIFVIIGYFGLRAALTSNPSEMKSTTEAFSFLEDSPWGAWLLGIVAAGLVGYAVYMFLMAKYRHFRDGESVNN